MLRLLEEDAFEEDPEDPKGQTRTSTKANPTPLIMLILCFQIQPVEPLFQIIGICKLKLMTVILKNMLI